MQIYGGGKKHQHRITVCCITQTITVNGMAGGEWSAFIQKVVEHKIQTFLGVFPPKQGAKSNFTVF